MNSPAPEPQTALSLLQQAALYRSQNRFGEALASAKQAIALDPARPEAWEFAGQLLLSRKKWREALALLTPVIGHFPTRPLLRSYYALALAKTGATAAAYEQVTEALRLQPDLTEAILAHIEILSDAGHYDLALQESLKLANKNLPETAAFCEGSLRFLTGDMTCGMQLLASVLKSGWRGKDLPEWNGEPAPDQHVVLYNGQAFGDLIQFIRYLDRLRQKAGKVTLQVPRAMERLIRDSFPDLPLIVETTDAESTKQSPSRSREGLGVGQDVGGSPQDSENYEGKQTPRPPSVPPASGREALTADASLRCSLISLAAMHGNFDPLPQAVPYLRADPELARAWRERLAHLPRTRIGLVWTSPWQMNNPFRTVDFAALKPLVDATGKHLVSLQMGPEAPQQAAAAGLFDASPFIKDFADSAALMSELDLVISLDSAPAHLAGALGRPVWMFLPFNGEWRWLAGREDCIWYPTMRLFRQQQPGNWNELFERMRDQLKLFLSGGVAQKRD